MRLELEEPAELDAMPHLVGDFVEAGRAKLARQRTYSRARSR